jgi:DNA-binding response OmpR family regulator
VLVADDSPVLRAVLRKQLDDRRFTVVEARDGEDALALARRMRPDVVLLDILMPNKDGYQVLEALKADPELAYIPVVFLTVRNTVEDVVRGLMLGAHDYLRKPFDVAELMARVTAAARVSDLHQELKERNAELDAFALQASHDLKSPLTAIKGVALTLLHQWRELDDDTRDELLKRIAGAADRSDRMVSDLLTLARQGIEPTRPDATSDPEAVVRSAVGSRDLAPAEVSVAGEWATVRMEEADLVSIIGNLIDNADHYGRSDDGWLRLHIVGAVTPDDVHVVVSDGGQGLGDDGDATRVFEPFFRLPSGTGRNPTSTGVGLAIVRRTLERWGGSIAVEGGEPAGAAFRMVIPRGEGVPAAGEAAIA